VINDGTDEQKAYHTFYVAICAFQRKERLEQQDIVRLLGLLNAYIQVPDKPEGTQNDLFNEFQLVWDRYRNENNP
jgi:hypothetical protein